MQGQEDGSVCEGHRHLCNTPLFQICLAALVFAWKRKHDSQFFVESLHDATKDLDLELEEYSRAHILHFRSSCSPDSAEEAERVSRIGKFQNCSVPTMQMGAQTLVQI